MQECEFDPWVKKIPWRRKWQSTLVFLSRKTHGQRSLVGWRPWGLKELATTYRLHNSKYRGVQFSSVQALSHVWFFATPRTAAHQASLSITNSSSLLKLMSIQSVMPSNHLICCHPLLILPSIFPSIRVFSKALVLCIRWSEYWSFSFSINPSNKYSGLISFRIY